jgi:hypothetical protein
VPEYGCSSLCSRVPSPPSVTALIAVPPMSMPMKFMEWAVGFED